MSDSPDFASGRTSTRNFRAFTDWLNMSPLGRDDPTTYISDDCAIIGPELLPSSAAAVSPRITGNPCKSKTDYSLHDTVMFAASSPTSRDESPFIIKSDPCLKSSASSTPVFTISPLFSRHLLSYGSPKTFLDSVPIEGDSESSYSDWPLDAQDISPIARTSLLLDVPKNCLTTHIFSLESADKNMQDICVRDRLDHSPVYWTLSGSTFPDDSQSLHADQFVNSSNKRDAISLHGTAPTTPVGGNTEVVTAITQVEKRASKSQKTNPAHGPGQDTSSPATPNSTVDSLKYQFLTPCSPLTPLSDCSNNSPNSIVDLRKKRKRSPSLSPTRLAGLRKLARRVRSLHQPKDEQPSPAISTSSMANSVADLPQLIVYPQRTFPESLNVNPEYPLFYRQFPLSSYFQFAGEFFPTVPFGAENPGGSYNPPRDIFDLYTPRFVKGKGCDKVGLCPICLESVVRGGSGKRIWLSMKFSAFKCYHLQYTHGISAVSARPFSPPTKFRMTARLRPLKTEKSEILEGKCHKCRKWIAVEGVKNVQVKVKELFWWKHAAMCHQGSQIDGEKDVFVQDNVYISFTDRV